MTENGIDIIDGDDCTDGRGTLRINVCCPNEVCGAFRKTLRWLKSYGIEPAIGTDEFGHFFRFSTKRLTGKRRAKFKAQLRQQFSNSPRCSVCHAFRPKVYGVENDDGEAVPVCEACFRERTQLVKDLVWKTFVGPVPEGQKVSHLNGDRTDNRLVNLCLVPEADYPGDDEQVCVLLL
jgi:hypothetical protein